MENMNNEDVTIEQVINFLKVRKLLNKVPKIQCIIDKIPVFVIKHYTHKSDYIIEISIDVNNCNDTSTIEELLNSEHTYIGFRLYEISSKRISYCNDLKETQDNRLN